MDNDFTMHPDANNFGEWLRIVLPKLCDGSWNIAECGPHRISRRVDGAYIVSAATLASIERSIKKS